MLRNALHPIIFSVIERIAFGLEILAVLVISSAILIATLRFIARFFATRSPQICLSDFKQIVGKSVQVALEILIAADIINTVVLDATIENVLVLGTLVIIRTFLSWTLVLETEGHWPWHKMP